MFFTIAKYSNLQTNFLSMDSEITFQKNLKIMPENWRWRNELIEYQTNSNGYRCKEFKDIDWNNAGLIFGDSNIFGIGLSRNLLASSILRDKTGIEIINLGIPGCGTDFIYYNIINALSESNLKPRFISIMWPNVFRRMWFINDIYFWIPQLSHTENLFKNIDDICLESSVYVDHYTKFFQIRRRHLKKFLEIQRIKYIDFLDPWIAETKEVFGCEDLYAIPDITPSNLPPDERYNRHYARDWSKENGAHWGPVYHEMFAKYIVSQL